MSNSITLHRVLKAPVERVYRAFTNPEAHASWIAPFGFIAKVHEFNPIVGGTYKMSFINFTNQQEHSFGGTYLEIKPNELLKYVDKFDDPNLPGEMTVTITFKQVSLIKLAQLVEPEINQ